MKAHVLRTDMPPRHPQVTVLVHDLELGDVPVRWRPPWWSAAWTWRCASCGTSKAADCPHKLAAAVHLAAELFGLDAAVNTPDPDRGHDERKPA